MIKSIQQFQTEGVKKLEKVFVDYSGRNATGRNWENWQTWVYSIPYTQVKKIASLKNHIWGL